MQASHKVSAVFDDPNLIGSAGLVPVMRLAERAVLHDLAAAGPPTSSDIDAVMARYATEPATKYAP